MFERFKEALRRKPTPEELHLKKEEKIFQLLISPLEAPFGAWAPEVRKRCIELGLNEPLFAGDLIDLDLYKTFGGIPSLTTTYTFTEDLIWGSAQWYGQQLGNKNQNVSEHNRRRFQEWKKTQRKV